ncbi:DUF4376 domain-containing protein [Halomonas alkaliantarctica]|nr:DUF4376 domain-containing protein [Halomonas alkaliantarctica]
MSHGITDKTGRVICDPIQYNRSRFADIITRYSGIPGNLPDVKPIGPVECGPLRVLPGQETRDPRPGPIGYRQESTGWQVNGDTLERRHKWVAIEDVEAVRSEAAEALAAIRYRTETGGITLADGSRIHTDRGSQAQLASAYQSLTQPFVASIDWKGPDGWVNVTEVELRPIAEAVAQHVQGCFTAERRVSEQQIDAATSVDDLLAIDLEAAFAAELEAVKAG